MSKNPLINALSALAYIIVISLVMYFGTRLMVGRQDNFLAPIAMLSLFTLSAAIMAYLFCYQPLQLYFDNQKKSAVDLFLKTVLIFGGLTIIALTILFSGIFS